ncbi:MAG: glycosyltransferase [Clostridiales bacterium]|jgi:glycosyltransferase involved in cell wall biosynthesis|nr:glycosyltransferase [Clostridiales bacterium]
MRILYITEGSIEHDIGGGAEGTKKVYAAIKRYCESNGGNFDVISLNDSLPESINLKPRKNRLLDILVRFTGHSNYLYFFWRKHRTDIFRLMPDISVLGRSRYGFIAKDIKNRLPSCKVVSVFENVELDYLSAYFSSDNSVATGLKKRLEEKAVRADEGDSVAYSDISVFLSLRDLNRTEELYQKQSIEHVIIPVCVKSRGPLDIKGVRKTLVFSGRLWYDANIESVMWLLDNIVPFYKDTPFIIAGTKPGEDMKERIAKYKNVTLYADFNDLADIIPEHSLVLSPTFRGAGMKVKVADALSVGLLVVGTDEAFVGYEEIADIDGVLRANNVAEFKSAIDKYLTMSDEELVKIGERNKAAFMRYYEYDRAFKAYQMIFDSFAL